MEMRFTDSRPQRSQDSSHGLRPLGWGELCARLVAAHDTRGALTAMRTGSDLGQGGARLGTASGQRADSYAESRMLKGFSFHDSAAALLQSVEVQAEGAVNLASSANGNDVRGNTSAVPNAAMKRRSDENCHD